MYYLEDFKVGISYEPKGRYRITEDEIMEIGARWDPQPFHIDREAASNSVFGGLIACSTHLFAVVCWFSHQLDESVAAVAGLGWDKIRMHTPVKAGDEISCKVKVLEARLSNSRPDGGVVTVQNDLFNQRNELVYSAQNSFLILRRPAKSS
jgi:acyl dehydratase